MLFEVKVEGDGLRLLVEGEWIEVGFFAIRHVLALSRQAAERNALRSVRRKMERERQAGRVECSDMKAVVNETEASHRYLKLLRQDGVVFYRAE
jgi:hypothetical protein